MGRLRPLTPEELKALGLLEQEQPMQEAAPEVPDANVAALAGMSGFFGNDLAEKMGAGIDTARDFIGEGDLNPNVRAVKERYAQKLQGADQMMGDALAANPELFRKVEVGGNVASLALPAAASARGLKLGSRAVAGAGAVKGELDDLAGAVGKTKLGSAVMQTAKEQLPGAAREIAGTSTLLKSLGTAGKFAKGVAGHMKDPRNMAALTAAGTPLMGVKAKIHEGFSRQLREKNGLPTPMKEDASTALDWIGQNLKNPYYMKQAMQGVIDEPSLSRKIVGGLAAGIGVPGPWDEEEAAEMQAEGPPTPEPESDEEPFGYRPPSPYR